MPFDLYVPVEDNRNIQRRLIYLFIGAACLFVLLLSRIWYLQIAKMDYYAALSENNRIRVVPIQPRRGFIYDRNANLLATFMPSFGLYLVVEDIPDKKALFERLAQLIDLPVAEAEERLSSRRSAIPYLPVKIKEGLSFREVAELEAHRMALPGIRIEAEPQRHYLYGSLAAHLLGYVREISAAQLEKKEFDGVLPGTVIGQSGVEKIFDSDLRAKGGKKIIEVDALGHEVNLLEHDEPLPVYDILLTIDLDVQKAAEEALGEQTGSIVAIDPNNGQILAMVSHPAFDPNQLSTGLTGEEWQALSQDPRNPLTNRATQGQYPPGSVFKIVVAAAGLETEQVDPQTEITCKGGLYFGGRMYRDWKRGGHGKTDLRTSIVQSCDVYYYQLGRLMGIDPIAKYAFAFGLGRPTGIDLTSEKSGLIPTTEWKRRARNEPWYPGENLSAAIGQGYVTVTPLQLADLIATVSVYGKRFKPELIRALRIRSTGELKEFSPEPLESVDVSRKSFDVIRDALAGVVTDKHGTGHAARTDVASVAGKTGTAQVISLARGAKTKEQAKEFQDHAWFVAFAPVENPKIAVSVLVEHGGHGGGAAAPLAKKVIEAYLRHDPSTNPDGL
jgi:penicillin-binding protein 2